MGTRVCTTFGRKLQGIGNLSVVVVVHEPPAALVRRETGDEAPGSWAGGCALASALVALCSAGRFEPPSQA